MDLFTEVLKKTTEGEKLEISSEKLEISGEHFTQRWGTIKNRNSRDLVDAEEIKKRWKEYMEELYKKRP